jgi:segregation and condensation protein A
MSRIMAYLELNPYMDFPSMFTGDEGRMGVVVSFLALMELCKERLVDLVQTEPMGQIYVRHPDARDETP